MSRIGPRQALHERFLDGCAQALGESLIFGPLLPTVHHHCTTSKVERVNCVIAVALRSLASCDRCYDWQARDLVPLVEFGSFSHQRLGVLAQTQLHSLHFLLCRSRSTPWLSSHPAGRAWPGCLLRDGGTFDAAASLRLQCRGTMGLMGRIAAA